MKKIAITGGIGSGKSLAGKYLSEQGYEVFSCDEIYAELIKSPAYILLIGQAFPDVIDNGEINRKKLSEKVFSCKENKARLDNIAHPLIMQTLFEKMDNAKGDLVFAEVPLLFENNYQNLFDHSLVILRNLENRIQAIMQRSDLTKEECLQRIATQFDYDTAFQNGRFPKNCSIIINDLDMQNLKEKILLFIDTVKHNS